MNETQEEPPRPPLEPLDSEESGCVAGMVLLVAIVVCALLVFIWLLRGF